MKALSGSMLDIAIAAAMAGGEVIALSHEKRHARGRPGASEKGPKDFVTAVDREAEAAIVGIIKEIYPDHDIIAEESPVTQAISDYRWIVDPLDGTTNFIHGYPMFSVSIGLSYRGRMTIGVIFDPLRRELFTAEAGRGAFLNDEPIRVSDIRKLDEALVLTGFPFRAPGYIDKYLSIFKSVFKASRGIRRAGSAALDLAYVACGRAEGFFELALSPWDMAAGAVLVLEAGGVVTDFEGGEAYMETGHVVAGNEEIVAQILPKIARQFPL